MSGLRQACVAEQGRYHVEHGDGYRCGHSLFSFGACCIAPDYGEFGSKFTGRRTSLQRRFYPQKRTFRATPPYGEFVPKAGVSATTPTNEIAQLTCGEAGSQRGCIPRSGTPKRMKIELKPNMRAGPSARLWYSCTLVRACRLSAGFHACAFARHAIQM